MGLPLGGLFVALFAGRVMSIKSTASTAKELALDRNGVQMRISASPPWARPRVGVPFPLSKIRLISVCCNHAGFTRPADLLQAP